ncbi:MAG: BglI family type II restriction endonuclease [Planctomycetia bacterium]|nr:BglI family type II restriction endonuclease [Planctomycetia bacterium]
MDPAAYNTVRAEFLKNKGASLIQVEEAVTFELLSGLLQRAKAIKADFDLAIALRMYWEEYAPLQRGHKPREDAYPWGEVGEKVIEGHLYSAANQLYPALRFPGLPYGHDVRFLTNTAFVQIDVKSTGPTDNADEIVASPNQVTGEGRLVSGWVQHKTRKVKGDQSTIKFRPELSPFVFIENKLYPVLTYYVKVVYSVRAKGDQPLEYVELACVPNGLLMFDGPKYHKRKGLLIPGKDEVEVKRKRTRIRLDPLSKIHDWRCVKMVLKDGKWGLIYRSSGKDVVLSAKTTGS